MKEKNNRSILFSFFLILAVLPFLSACTDEAEHSVRQTPESVRFEIGARTDLGEVTTRLDATAQAATHWQKDDKLVVQGRYCDSKDNNLLTVYYAATATANADASTGIAPWTFTEIDGSAISLNLEEGETALPGQIPWLLGAATCHFTAYYCGSGSTATVAADNSLAINLVGNADLLQSQSLSVTKSNGTVSIDNFAHLYCRLRITNIAPEQVVWVKDGAVPHQLLVSPKGERTFATQPNVLRLTAQPTSGNGLEQQTALYYVHNAAGENNLQYALASNTPDTPPAEETFKVVRDQHNFLPGRSYTLNPVSEDVAPGDYDPANPYRGGIYNKADLLAFAQAVNQGEDISAWTSAGVVALMRNIDLTGETEFAGIGNSDHPFVGVFEGNDNLLSGFKLDGEKGGYTKDIGLFGAVGAAEAPRSVVRNLRVQVLNTAPIDSTLSSLGGIVGRLQNGQVNHCSFEGKVKGADNVGGIVGENLGGTIAHCTMKGWVEGRNCVGGIVGYNSGTVIACQSGLGMREWTKGTGDNVGGIVGRNIGTATQQALVHGCALIHITLDNDRYNVQGSHSVGGIVGSNDAYAAVVASGGIAGVTSTGPSMRGSVGGVAGTNLTQTSYLIGCYTIAYTVVGGSRKPIYMYVDYWNENRSGVTCCPKAYNSNTRGCYYYTQTLINAALSMNYTPFIGINNEGRAYSLPGQAEHLEWEAPKLPITGWLGGLSETEVAMMNNAIRKAADEGIISRYTYHWKYQYTIIATELYNSYPLLITGTITPSIQ